MDLAVIGPGNDARRLLSEGPQIGLFDGRLNCRGIKVSFDGALGSKGAALLEKYADYDTAGFLKWKEEDLLPMFEESLRKGVQIWTHAIGDRTNREILNLYEKAFNKIPPAERKVKEPRWRGRARANRQSSRHPSFREARRAPLDATIARHWRSALCGQPSGPARLEGAYAWQSFIKAGSIIPGGSDAPVERGEPMIEFYAAVARKDLKGFSGEGWHPEQAVSREQALKMFTLWAAYAAFEEQSRGSLEPGKVADMTVLSQDIMQIPAAEIPNTTCAMTIINGEVVYRRGKGRRQRGNASAFALPVPLGSLRRAQG